MQSIAPSLLVRSLRLTALVILLTGLFVWLQSGARLGWTQTSVVAMQRDEITGIDFPVRRDAFVAGVEVPLLASAVAAAAAGLSLLAQRRAVAVRS